MAATPQSAAHRGRSRVRGRCGRWSAEDAANAPVARPRDARRRITLRHRPTHRAMSTPLIALEGPLPTRRQAALFAGKAWGLRLRRALRDAVGGPDRHAA